MIFNGIEKPYISVVKGRVLPFFAPLSREFNRFDSKLLSTERGTRIISVPIYISHDGYTSFQRLKEDIADWLIHDEPKVLEFKDDPDRFYWAVVDGEIDNVIDYDHGAEAVINFACGYKRGSDKTIEVDGTITELIGGHVDTTYQTKTVFNENTDIFEFKFQAEGADTSLRNINSIKMNYAFKKNDTLVIEYDRRCATLNGNDITNSISILQSNFKKVPKGETIFTTSHPTSILYNERYY